MARERVVSHFGLALNRLCVMVAACWGIGLCAVAAAQVAQEKLPADGIYPRGQKLAFMGYSGDPARDLANGFTAAGPVYGDQQPYLERCFQNGWPVVAHVGPRITFKDNDPAKYKPDPVRLRQEVEQQVRSLATHKEVAWWAIRPEELRPWRSDEMRYLDILCDTIRKNDPQGRPIFLYNPNHRDAASLLPIAKQVEILAKGCYVNSVGRKRDRAWVRWSVEQEIQAIRSAGRPNAIPLVMPELCRAPEPSEDQEIRAWARHDVYLGMVSGAKGVLIWSLFKRKEVRRTWKVWYDAYSECARELNGDRRLAQVFLFGQPESTLTIRQVQGPTASSVTLGGSAENTTTSDKERAKRKIDVPSWSSAEFLHAHSRWLFVVNSANVPAAFAVTGWPTDSRPQNAFTDESLPVQAGGSLRLELPAYGVVGVRCPLANAKTK